MTRWDNSSQQVCPGIWAIFIVVAWITFNIPNLTYWNTLEPFLNKIKTTFKFGCLCDSNHRYWCHLVINISSNYQLLAQQGPPCFRICRPSVIFVVIVYPPPIIPTPHPLPPTTTTPFSVPKRNTGKCFERPAKILRGMQIFGKILKQQQEEESRHFGSSPLINCPAYFLVLKQKVWI